MIRLEKPLVFWKVSFKLRVPLLSRHSKNVLLLLGLAQAAPERLGGGPSLQAMLIATWNAVPHPMRLV